MRVTRLQKIQALKESIAHWRRMIKWVKTQNPKDFASSKGMYYKLHETWGATNCALCNIFNVAYNHCRNCPIRTGDGCCCKEYEEVDNSNIWKEWLTSAKGMLKLLETKKAELEEDSK